MKFITILATCLGLCAFTCTTHSIANEPTFHRSPTQSTSTPAPPIWEPIQLPQYFSADNVSILIKKSDYTLSVLHGDQVLKSYPVVLGPDPVKDKRREGDGCTPEGTFHIRDKYPHRSWSYFIWVDYPTADSWKKHKAAQKAGIIDQSATIGGEIGIHGVPEGYDNLISEGKNWTAGCISLTTAAISEIYPLVKVGTAIEIRH